MHLTVIMMEKQKIKVMIAAGGTGGHLFPGVAIAQEIVRQHPDVKVIFAGTAQGLEATVLAKLNWPMVVVGSVSTREHNIFATISKWAALPIAIARAFAIIIRERPRLLISIGGLAAAPLAIAAWVTRVPFVAIEPNAIAGFTNRKLGPFCKRAFVQFEESKKYFSAGKAALTGIPVRAEITDLKIKERTGSKITIFVFGGSGGAVKLNKAIVESLKSLRDLADKIDFVHQAGRNDNIQEIIRAYSSAGFSAEVFEFTDRIWDCYAKADFIVARAGGITIAELSVLKIPSIMVPYPYAADDHQRANANALERAGCTKVIDDRDCAGENMAREIRGYIEKPERLSQMREALSKFGKPDAATKIVEESFKFLSAS